MASCSFGFQDFSSLRILYAAVTDHITEKVGCTARLDGVVCGFDDSDLLSLLPAALLGDNSDHLGSGHLASVLRSPADLRAVADLYFGGDYRLAADRVRAGSLSAPAFGASPGRKPRAISLVVDPSGESVPFSSAGVANGVTAPPADVVRPASGDDVGLGAEDSTSPPPTGSLHLASRASDLDGAFFSNPPARPAGGAQLLLDAFGDHRDIVPCFKQLRRLLGLALADPLPSPPELEARIASSPQNLLVIGRYAEHRPSGGHLEGLHPEGGREPLPGGRSGPSLCGVPRLPLHSPISGGGRRRLDGGAKSREPFGVLTLFATAVDGGVRGSGPGGDA